MTKTLLFLYAELAGYALSCMERLSKQADVHIVHLPVNKEAPFRFDAADVVRYDRHNYSTQELLNLVQEIQPDIVICCGWIDKGYLKVCKSYYGKVPTVLTMDNHWTGSLRQYMASLAAPFYLQTKFSHIWIPGEAQLEYARKLGFKRIMSGFYSADVDYFLRKYRENIGQKKQGFPKRFIFTGRYVQHKGIFDLWRAFVQLQDEQPNKWELWCLGTGALYDQRVQHEKIKHFGFVQPEDMGKYINQTGVFVLPSHFEPWGVAVHEFAAAGFPLICSDKVGAAGEFLETGVNGYCFRSGNVKDLKLAMVKVMRLSDSELLEMGERSAEKAKTITPENWTETLMGVVNGGKCEWEKHRNW